MDPRRFDTLARSAVTNPSRRLAIPALLGALFGLPQLVEARKHGEANADARQHRDAKAEVRKDAGAKVNTRKHAGGKAERSGRPDISKFEKEIHEGKLLKQDTASGGDGGRVSSEGVQAEAVGIAQIWYRDCSTTTTKFCGVRCPSTKQAINGGVLDMSPNAVFFFDRPGDTIRDWWAGFGSTDALSATARAFAVCLNK